jgi:hypothetical protein
MNKLTISYLTMRKAIGYIAMVFPFALIIGNLLGGLTPMQNSLSEYYWTNSNIIFVSMLVTFGIFLLSYNGYDKRDKWITSVAGVSMLLVAFFPCEGSPVPDYLFMFLPVKASAIIHYTAAISTFSLLGVMSLFQFTQGSSNTEQKKKRNLIYKVSGITIFVVITLMIANQLIPHSKETTDTFKLLYWLESIVLWAFGIAWLVKGEAFLKD